MFYRLALSAVCTLIAFTSRCDAAAAPVDAPDGWSTSSPRSEIAPGAEVVRSGGGGGGEYVLVLTGDGNPAVDGVWQRREAVSAGKYYAFHAEFHAERVATPQRSVLARVIWRDAAQKQIGTAEYPLTAPQSNTGAPGDWRALVATYQAPPKATAAQLELQLRWAADGRVQFRHVEFKETQPPQPRKVRFASVNFRPANSPSPQANLDAFGKLIARAADEDKADIVCLPEGITVCGLKPVRTYVDVAQPVPGPDTEFLGKVAAAHKVYVIAGVYERDAKAVYNTAVLIGRDGKLVGKYRKVCLPREEIDAGITPGSDYPVFDTDFGRVGMMICWDVHFPEVARELSARGAEVIFMPVWGGNETLARARAIENQVYLVASGYDFRTAIYNKAGDATVKAEKNGEVVVTEVDLNERLLWPWLGDWRARIWREGPARKD